MTIYFGHQRKWVIRAVGWFAITLLIALNIFLGFYKNSDLIVFFVVWWSVFLVMTVYFGIYNLRKAEKRYIEATENSLSLYRGSLVSRQRVLFKDVNRLYETKTLIALCLDGGKEVQLDTEILSNSELKEIREWIEKYSDLDNKEGGLTDG